MRIRRNGAGNAGWDVTVDFDPITKGEAVALDLRVERVVEEAVGRLVREIVELDTDACTVTFTVQERTLSDAGRTGRRVRAELEQAIEDTYGRYRLTGGAPGKMFRRS